jgi:NAD(P)-dependent dehydrogenase (short-subunit alcohol dehydrogenase family)
MSDYLHRLFSLQGKVAIVTGASRGIGAVLASALSQAGAITLGLGRSAAPAIQYSGDVVYRSCDILDDAAFAALCETVFNEHGRIDILVNAAGITLPKAEGVEAVRNFERTIATNLSAVHHCCRSAAHFMQQGSGGSIINVTSIGSVLGFPDNPAYVASKGGLRIMTKGLALDLACDGIRVNNLAPGYIRTEMTEASYQNPERHAQRLQHMMLKRWGNPEDLAGAAIYLASDASSYVTGADLFVDGGWTAKGM